MTQQSYFNVRNFGAIGDGIAKDTIALQKAIDTCHKAGGGKVLLPAGRYLSGTIYLKNNVELHLAAGAVLLGSPDAEDYNPDDIFPENRPLAKKEKVTGRHLVIAYQQENISITGNGIIDGNSSVFFEPLPADVTATYRGKNGDYPFTRQRPGQMVFFCRCNNVVVRDVKLWNAPHWTLFLLGCIDIQIYGLHIQNPPATANGDGIDIDCCRNVTISDCIIRTGDDAITLRANKRVLGKNALPCENVTVSNCLLSSACNAIRVGVGEIRNCLFNNIIISEAGRGISLVSLYRKTEWSQHGTCIENVHFTNFLIDADVPIAVGVGEGARTPATIQDISFHCIRSTTWAGTKIAGTPEVPVQRIRLRDCEWLVCGGTDNLEFQEKIPDPHPHHGHRGRDGSPALPCAFYGVDIDGLTVENLRLRWEDISQVWSNGIRLERVSDIELRNVSLRQPQADAAAIYCHQCSNVSLIG